MKRLISKFLIVWIILSIHPVISTQAADFQSDITVNTEDELVTALADTNIQSVNIGTDIEISKNTTLYINGDNKFINGNNHVLNVTNGDISITSNVKINGLNNIKINSTNNINLILKYGGNIDNLQGDKVTISSNSNLELNRSSLAYVTIDNGSDSKIVDSEINGQGINLNNSQNIIIDKVNIDLGDTYNNGIVLSGRTSSDISNTTITGGAHGIYSYMNGMSTNITNTKISGSKYYGIHNNGDVNGSFLTLSNVEIADTGSYGIYNTGTNSQGSITIDSGGTLTLNTGNNIGIYQEYGYLNVLGDVIHAGGQYTLFNSSNSTLNDPNGNMKLMYQDSSAFLYNSTNRSGDDVVLTSVKVKTEEELRNALLDDKVNNVQLTNNIEISNPSNIEVNGILKKLSGENFKLTFSDNINPQIVSNQFLEIEDLTINNNILGYLTLNKGGNLSNVISPKMNLNSSGETHVLNSELEGISISNGNNSKIINSTVGTYGIYLYLSQNTIIDKVNINLGDTYNNGIVLSGRTSSDISNTTITGGAHGIYSYMNGMSTNIMNTKISGSKYYGIYNNGDVNGSFLTLSNVEIADTGSYGIYNTGTNSQGFITVAPETTLTLHTGNNIGVYQENGYFDLYGNINSTSSGTIISSDYKSQTIDHTNQLIFLNPETNSFKNYVMIDGTTPQTIVSLVKEDWSNTDVPLTLTATDNLSGVAKTEYKINDGGWVPYTNGILVTTEGANTIYYRSVDNAGNVEDIKSVEVKIDKTAPTLAVSFNPMVITKGNHRMVPIAATINSNDSLSGVASVQLVSIVSNQPDNGTSDGNTTQDIQNADFGILDTNFLIRAEKSGGKERIYTVTYKVTDNARNSTVTTQTITVKHDNSSK